MKLLPSRASWMAPVVLVAGCWVEAEELSDWQTGETGDPAPFWSDWVEVLDQEQAEVDYGYQISVPRNQDFQPTLEVMTRVAVMIDRGEILPSPLVLEIRDARGEVVDTATIEALDATDERSWVSVELTEPVLTSQQKLTVSLHAQEPSEDPQTRFAWFGHTASEYPCASSVDDPISGTGETFDFAFRTYGLAPP